ncbi:hypothetical protein ACGFNU_46260 [Spirillospora sp. NPDC048911]|uniref:hypothetical protein n=1 Tax=Spirillospora sp. NPDC048911 TaxID=3364527 RepID=UPI0037236E1B
MGAGRALGAVETMMDTATTEAGTAAFVLPPAALVTFEFKISTGDAPALDVAGQAWRDASAAIQKLISELPQNVQGIPAQAWTDTARPQYEAKIQEFCSQLEALEAYCQAVGVALTTVAYALFTYAIFAIAMGTFLAGLAVAVIAAAASVVGSPAIAGMQATAATCLTITHVATAILAMCGQIVAAILAGGALLTAVTEKGRGNDQALDDFMQAQATGAAGAAANLAQNVANAGLSFVNRYQDAATIPGSKVKPPKGVPLQEVDFDADRGFDKTWNVGAGATIETGAGGTHEVGVNGKKGDGEAWGVGGEYKYEGPLGNSGGVKGGYEQDQDGKPQWNVEAEGQNKAGVGGNVGYEHDDKGHDKVKGGVTVEDPTGSVKGGVEGNVNADTGEWGGKANGQYAPGGAQVAQGSGEVTGQGWNVNEANGDLQPPWEVR